MTQPPSGTILLGQVPAYPFTAIVGQDQMRLALLVAAVSPRIGGILIRGDRGTAKSTMARGLAALLPEIAVVAGCRFGCDPLAGAMRCPECVSRAPQQASYDVETRATRMVTLPLGATEDRLLGSLDVEQALAHGIRRFELGLLARAHRGVLYVDEVNLLPDHLVDGLLDAAAMRVNHVERDGVSFEHPADFLLIGTMNPEEGDLRPQLLDRFALSVEVRSSADQLERTEAIRRRICFDEDPIHFHGVWQEQEDAERARIQTARDRLSSVRISDDVLGMIARISAAYGLDGLRADLAMYKAAAALAALASRLEVTREDVRAAAEMAIPHRQRHQPFDDCTFDTERLKALTSDDEGGADPDPPSDRNPSGSPPPDGPGDDRNPPTSPGAPAAGEAGNGSGRPGQNETWTFPIGTAGKLPPFLTAFPPAPNPGPIRREARGRNQARESPRGRHWRSVASDSWRSATESRELDVQATLCAGALSKATGTASEHFPRVPTGRENGRYKVRTATAPTSILFVVDASGSMAARRRMVAAKGAILSLLCEAYRRRHQVGLIAFRGTSAAVILPLTRGVDVAHARLRALPTGGRTPLAAGLDLALQTLVRPRGPKQAEDALLVLVSDGRANVARGSIPAVEDARRAAQQLRHSRVRSLVVDTEGGPVRLGLASQIAQYLGAACIPLATLQPADAADQAEARFLARTVLNARAAADIGRLPYR